MITFATFDGDVAPGEWRVETTPDGAAEVMTKREGQSVKFCEEPDAPAREALESLGDRLRTTRVLLVPTLCALSLDRILAGADKLKRLLVVDYNPKRLRAWREAMPDDLPSVIKPLLVSNDPAKAELEIKYRVLERRDFLASGDSAVYFPRRFRRLEKTFATFVETALLRVQQQICSGTAFRRTRSWHLAMNALLNAARLPETLIAAVTREKTCPVVIVGAGPSLNEALPILKAREKEFILIATEAALGALLKRGVRPDFIVSLEDAVVSWRFFADRPDLPPDIPLVVPLTANHELVRRYPGPVMFYRSPGAPAWHKALCRRLPVISHGLCVGHLAFHFAEHLNPEAIVMVGFDLSFRDGARHHADMPAISNNADETNLVEVETADGKRRRTFLAFYFYLKYFEEAIANSAYPVVNTALEGALVRGATCRTLEETLDTIAPRQKRVVVSRLSGVTDTAIGDFYRRTERRLDTLALAAKSEKDPEKYRRTISDALADAATFDLVETCADIDAGDEDVSRREALTDIAAANAVGGAVAFLQSVLRCRQIRPIPGKILFLAPPAAPHETFAAFFRRLGTVPAKTIPADTAFPDILRAIAEERPETVVCVDGQIIPDVWTVANIACVDLKTRFEPRPYEDTFWTPGYKVLCVDAEIYKAWRAFAPEYAKVEWIAGA